MISAARYTPSRALFALLSGLALGSFASAAATVEESFAYPTGNFADGTPATGFGMSGNWTCGAGGTITSGLSYAGLPAVDNALSSSGARQFANFSTPLSNGTQWIGFLFKSNAGNPGANSNGVFFPNANASSLWFGFGLAPYSATEGELGLGSIATAGIAAVSANSLQLLGRGTYGSTYLVVLKIEFDTSGNNDQVTVYLNPVTGQTTPGVAAAAAYGGFDVGTISGMGLNVTGAGSIFLDEIRVGEAYSDAVGFISVTPDAPAAPAVLAGDNSVTLSWAVPAGKPSSYTIKRSTTIGSGYETIGTTEAPIVTFTDSILGGETYYYVVTAANEAGESDESPPATALPILAPPAEPTGLTADPRDAEVILNWTGSTFATGYNVKIATAPEGPYLTVGSTVAPEVSYTDANNLTNGSTYYYVVAATGAGGEGPNSLPVEATPIAPPPLIADLQPGVGIRWFAEEGVVYQVQWASELLEADTDWHNLGGRITGDGTMKTVSEVAGPPHNHYQVVSFQ